MSNSITRLAQFGPMFLLLWVPCVGAGSAPLTEDQPVDFVKDIQPIFEASCNQCHGSEQQTNGLRLDSRDSAFQEGNSGPAIVPGSSSQSLLYRKLLGQAEGSPMPLSGELSPEQIALIGAWLDQGAKWPDSARAALRPAKKHWAYVKPVRPELPPVENSGWMRNPIDRFILARLEKEGLEPNPEASRGTLIRRVKLDLIGLPPTPEEVDAFVADPSPDAYEKLVDELMASPHYGERWARPWLDLARYADTNGYIHDWRRSVWPYRDWVIKALNSDLPFDQFTIQQIAGDLLPETNCFGSCDEISLKVATGFHRNTMINTEGGIDPEEYRVAAILDRVETTSTVWLGSTLSCAQCHDHKYDPFTQEEYYRMFAFFNSTMEEANSAKNIGPRDASITLAPPDYLKPQRSDVEQEVMQLKATLKRSTPELEAAQAAWEEEKGSNLVSWSVLDPITYLSLAKADLQKLDDGSLLAGGPTPSRDTYLVTAETRAQGITALRLETLTHPSLPRGGSSRSPSGEFHLTELEVSAEPLSGPSSPKPIRFESTVAEYEKVGLGFGEYEIRQTLDGASSTGWSINGDQDEFRVDRQAIFLPEEPIGFPGGTRLAFRIRHEGKDQPQQIVGRFRLSLTQEQDPARSVKLPSWVETVLPIPPAQRSDEETKNLAEYYRSIAPSLEPVRNRLDELLTFWDQLTSPRSLVMKELDPPRKTHFFIKGSFLNPGKEVQPGVPAVLHRLVEEEGRPNRLSLARWLVSPENPLVGRVTMNRFWYHHFGRPLVKTPEDLGTQGAPPSHPLLLDWLATEFIQQGWSMKAMHRLIVTSATYRQASRASQPLLERDPYNELYARGPRFRMDAEMIRDNALSIAGLLNLRMYGPSVFPSQPEGLWDTLYAPDTWNKGVGEDRYRRGLYTFLKRIRLYPFFSNFDAPSRETACVVRTRSNTPLQALNLMNDEVFLEAARGLARRMVTEAGPRVERRVSRGLRLSLGRQPEQREIEELTALYQDQLGNISSQKGITSTALNTDGKGDAKVTEREFLAWTTVAQALLNLDESISRP